MTTSDKLLVIQTQDRVVGVKELGVEDNLDPVRGSVEQFDPSDLAEDGIVGVVGHVVRGDGRERVSLEGKDSSLEKNLVFIRQKLLGFGDLGSVLTSWSACYYKIGRASGHTQNT